MLVVCAHCIEFEQLEGLNARGLLVHSNRDACKSVYCRWGSGVQLMCAMTVMHMCLLHASLAGKVLLSYACPLGLRMWMYVVTFK